MTSLVTNTIVAVKSGLSGQTTSSTSADIKFYKGDPYSLCEEIDAQTGDFSVQNTNQLNVAAKIHFLHFGQDHLDRDKNFKGGATQQKANVNGDQADKGKNRGKVFRDCLEREAILLHGYIYSCKAALKSYNENMGFMGLASEALDLLTGGSDSPPDAGELDKLLKRAADVCDTINKSDIQYTDVHKAGKDLHQIRGDFEKFATEQLEKYYLDRNQYTGTWGAIKGQIAAKMPWYFTVPVQTMDIWLGMLLCLRSVADPAIADRSYRLSMEAIKDDDLSPSTFDLWSNKPKKDTTSQDTSDDKPAIGDKYLDEIFDALIITDKEEEDAKDDAAKKKLADRPAAYPAFFLALSKVTGQIQGEFFPKLLRKWTERNVAYLKHVYKEAAKDISKAVDEDFLLKGAREYLLEAAVEIIYGLSDTVKGWGGTASGTWTMLQKLGGSLKNKGPDWLEGKIADHMKFLDCILKVAVGYDLNKDAQAANLSAAEKKKRQDAWNMRDKTDDLVSILRAGYDPANQAKALTMEVLLSRLPLALTAMVRNTLFVGWAYLLDFIEEYLGLSYLKTAMGAVSKSASWLDGKKQSVTKGVDSAKNQQQVGDTAGNILDGIKQGAGNAGKVVGNLLNVLVPDGPEFPIKSRVADGTGKEVTSDDVTKVQDQYDKNDIKVEDKPKDGANPATPGTPPPTPTPNPPPH